MLTATLALAAASWLVALQRMDGMDMGVATELGSLGSFAVVWVPMMAAMMLPGAVPALLTRAAGDRSRVAALPFAGSYLAVWALVGLAVYALYRPPRRGRRRRPDDRRRASTSSRRSSASAAGAAARASAPARGSGSAASARASG